MPEINENITLGDFRRTDQVQIGHIDDPSDMLLGDDPSLLPLSVLRVAYRTYYSEQQLVDVYAVPLPILAALYGQISHLRHGVLNPEQVAVFDAVELATFKHCQSS